MSQIKVPVQPTITLTTDFGTQDGYVGEMKGVLVSHAPAAPIIDITHDVPAQDVESARLLVARFWRRFPKGTTHLVVVDPGVGSQRAALAVQSDDRYLVGPDNGVLSPALLLKGARVVALPIPPTAAPTFHGRDVFAPAAAALASGTPIDELGLEFLDPIIRRTPEPTRMPDGGIAGEIIAIDRFGNAMTNLVGLRGGSVTVGDRELPVRRTYADTESGAPLGVVGSSGFIEVAIRNGNAARELGLARGVRVVLHVAR